jgi:menaquinone-specific isochorismate synthase
MEPTRSDPQAVAAAVESGVVCGCRVETADVRSFLRLVDRPRVGWADQTQTVAGGGAAATVAASGDGRFDRVRERATRLFDRLRTGEVPDPVEPRLYGGFAFTDAHTSNTSDTWAGYPGAMFVLPAVQLSLRADGAWLMAAATGQRASETARHRLERWRTRLVALPALEGTSPPGVTGMSYTPSRERWRSQVGTTAERIRADGLEKVVLAQSLTATLSRPANPADILARLAGPYPDCDRFLFAPARGGIFFGATPERLVTVDGECVETEALAGSTSRGETPAEDDRLADRLRASEKNRHEHALVVDAIRDQLRAVAGDIETGDRAVRRLSNVQHLRTPLRGVLDREQHVLDLVEALHPTPAVGGLPPDDALATIRDTEAFDRGWYAAPIGWFDADGNGSFSVAIRSGVAADRQVTTFAGAGIVADSDPDREWTELQLKYRPVLDELS